MIIILVLLFSLNLFSQDFDENIIENQNKSTEYFNNISINVTKKIVFDTNRLLLNPTKTKKYFDNMQVKKTSNNSQINNMNNQNLDDFKIIKIYNVYGVEINKLNLSDLSQGLYFVVYQKTNILTTKKIKIE